MGPWPQPGLRAVGERTGLHRPVARQKQHRAPVVNGAEPGQTPLCENAARSVQRPPGAATAQHEHADSVPHREPGLG
ncbi:hypothetical protein [Streptomyces sp. NPDC018000]|uniref:hypothetical protein n=1 Tax=Streptomyces sp. NPDC018000 TaxID=3365028 RepID=UPI00379694A7